MMKKSNCIRSIDLFGVNTSAYPFNSLLDRLLYDDSNDENRDILN